MISLSQKPFRAVGPYHSTFEPGPRAPRSALVRGLAQQEGASHTRPRTRPRTGVVTQIAADLSRERLPHVSGWACSGGRIF